MGCRGGPDRHKAGQDEELTMLATTDVTDVTAAIASLIAAGVPEGEPSRPGHAAVS